MTNPKIERKDVAKLRGQPPRGPRPVRAPDKPAPARTSFQADGESFGPINACIMRVRLEVCEAMNFVPRDQWPEVIAAVREDIDDLAKQRALDHWRGGRQRL
jgi:hypothetical protein